MNPTAKEYEVLIKLITNCNYYTFKCQGKYHITNNRDIISDNIIKDFNTTAYKSYLIETTFDLSILSTGKTKEEAWQKLYIKMNT
jgi:hypothetical protein